MPIRLKLLRCALFTLGASAFAFDSGHVLHVSKTGWNSLVKMEVSLGSMVCAQDRGQTIACGEVRYQWGTKVVVRWTRRATGTVPKRDMVVTFGEDMETMLMEVPNGINPFELESESAGYLFGLSTQKSAK